MSAVEKYTEKTQLRDFAFSCTDGSLWWSGNLMCHHSEFLCALYMSGEHEITVDYSCHVVAALLNCVDTDELELSDQPLRDLYVLSHKWNFACVEKRCVDKLILAPTIDTFMLMHQLHCSRLDDAADVLLYSLCSSNNPLLHSLGGALNRHNAMLKKSLLEAIDTPDIPLRKKAYIKDTYNTVITREMNNLLANMYRRS